MRKRIKRAGDVAGVDMTPMLDIVFIMLIFFIVAAVFLDEHGVALAEAPDAPPAPVTAPPTIVVQLDANDLAIVEGRVADLASVPSRVQASLADKPGANILLQADPAASVDAVVSLKDRFNASELPVTLKIDPQPATSAR